VGSTGERGGEEGEKERGREEEKSGGALKSTVVTGSLINKPKSDGNRDHRTTPDLAQRGSMENGMRVNNGAALRSCTCGPRVGIRRDGMLVHPCSVAGRLALRKRRGEAEFRIPPQKRERHFRGRVCSHQLGTEI